ncbi:MAG: hypothetical protein WA005_03035 [Candidatus Binataceae bacterium]
MSRQLRSQSNAQREREERGIATHNDHINALGRAGAPWYAQP